MHPASLLLHSILGGPVESTAPVPLEQAIHVEFEHRCVNAAAIAHEAEEWLESGQLQTDLSFRVDDDDAGLRVSTLRGSEVVGTREFDEFPAGCDRANKVLGLVIALSIDEAAAAPLEPSSLETNPPAPDPTNLPPVPAEPGPPSRLEPSGLQLQLDLLWGANYLHGPGLTSGLQIDGLHRWYGFRARVEGGFSPRFALEPRSSQVSNVAVRVGSFWADVGPCFGRRWRDRPLTVLGCAAVGPSAFVAEALIPESRRTTQPAVRVALGLAVQVQGASRRAGWILAIDGVTHLPRVRFETQFPDRAVSASRTTPFVGIYVSTGATFTLSSPSPQKKLRSKPQQQPESRQQP